MEKELELLDEEIDEEIEIINGEKIRFNFSFEARLIQTTDENKEYYAQIKNLIHSYGLKTSTSWKQERIYLGRKTLGAILFRGKKLCVAMALDPKKYEETKYRGVDLSEVKRFEEMPMLLKISSDRKLKYVKELLVVVCQENEIEMKEEKNETYDFPFENTEVLLEKGLVKRIVSKTTTKVRKPKVQTEVVIKTEEAEKEPEVAVKEAPKPKKEIAKEIKPVKKVEVYQKSAVKKEYKHPKKANRKGIINIANLKNVDADVITAEVLKQQGFIKKNIGFVKLLGLGTVNKVYHIELNSCSKKAYNKVVNAKGTFRKA